jgi:hypothetical protein
MRTRCRQCWPSAYGLSTEKKTAGDEILFALPEEIRRGRVSITVEFNPDLSRIMGETEFEPTFARSPAVSRPGSRL